MARPKTKSLLAEGIKELVSSIRNIESKLHLVIAKQKHSSFLKQRGPGRPPGTGKKRKPGRPAGKRGPGRPPGSINKNKLGRAVVGKSKRGPGRPPGIKITLKNGRSKSRRRGRPVGSKNK